MSKYNKQIYPIQELLSYLLKRGIKMTQTLNLPDVISEDLTSISDDLSSLAKKPISAAMTITLLIEVYRAYMSEPCARDAFRQKVATSNFMTPEAFDKKWNTKPTETAKKLS
jgi:hypothetical protein